MSLRNRRGRRVDPVPFLIASLLGFTVSFSYGPGYLMALGLTLPQSIGGAALASLGIAGVAYYRYVWTHRPDLLAEVPVESRLKRLFYGALLGLAILALLALPLLFP